MTDQQKADNHMLKVSVILISILIMLCLYIYPKLEKESRELKIENHSELTTKNLSE